MTWTDSPAVRAACLAGGLALAGTLGAAAAVRRDRPLHAYGSTHPATLTVSSPAHAGVPLLDSQGSTPAVVRTSRAISLTRTGPDIMGLAMRCAGRDLLFASTGTSRLGRYVLQLHRRVDDGPLTTLLPMRTRTGSLQVALLPLAEGTWRVAWSRPGIGAWTPVGSLHVERAELPDPGHFDPTGSPPEGLQPAAWVLALRSPAYRLARTLVPLPRRR